MVIITVIILVCMVLIDTIVLTKTFNCMIENVKLKAECNNLNNENQVLVHEDKVLRNKLKEYKNKLVLAGIIKEDGEDAKEEYTKTPYSLVDDILKGDIEL